MTKTTVPNREELEQEAAAAERRAADLRARMRAEDEAAARRRREAQRKFDEDFADGFARSKIDADVDQARQALDAALAADPLVAALADYLTALRRRSHMLLEHSSTLSRLGRPSYTPTTQQTELDPLDDYVHRVVTQIATERVTAELDDIHAARDAAGADTKETR